MINIVIPMAGRGSRFVTAGFVNPKPFIDVEGVPMIQRVIDNLTPYEPYRFIFLARREHEEFIRTHMSFATDIIWVDEVTEGAACTVLLASKLINTTDPLIIANSDQFVEWNDETETKYATEFGPKYWRESNNIQDMINCARDENLDAMIATFYATHPKWSYAKLSKGLVTKVAEKKVISNEATVGVYYYRYGSDFVTAARQMIDKNIRVNNEFYVCPVFNEMIEAKLKIGTYRVSAMHGMGTPEDLIKFKMRLRCRGEIKNGYINL